MMTVQNCKVQCTVELPHTKDIDVFNPRPLFVYIQDTDIIIIIAYEERMKNMCVKLLLHMLLCVYGLPRVSERYFLVVTDWKWVYHTMAGKENKAVRGRHALVHTLTHIDRQQQS